MSTRCQIEFQNFWKDDKGNEHIDRRTVYRHSDGNPEGVIPNLKEFLKWNKGRNNDVEYTTANFIYWSKRWHEQNYFNKDVNGKIENKNLKWSDNQLTNSSILHIGFGVCENDEFHGDIEYFYKVINKDKTIKIKAYKVDRENWDDEITKKNMKFIKKTIVKEVL